VPAERRERGEADHRPHLRGGVQEPGGEPGALGQRGGARGGRGGCRDAEPEAHDDIGGDERAGEEQAGSAGHAREPGRHPPAEQRPGDHRKVERDAHQAGVGRAAMELLLLVEDREQHRRRGRGGQRSRDDVRADERTVAQDGEREDRIARTALDRQERREQDRGSGQRGRRALRAAEHERDERGGDRGGPGQVERGTPPRALRGREHARRERDAGEPERDVDDEDRRPAVALGQDAAEHPAARAAARGRRGPHADRASAQQRERRRRHQRAPGALDGAQADEHGRRGGKRATGRCRGEQRESGGEEPAVAEHVAGAARGNQQAAERERVRRHDPLQRRGAEAEVALDRGQSDGDDRRVEDGDELDAAEQGDGHGPGLPVANGFMR